MPSLCKTCDLSVSRFVINCYKLSPIHKFCGGSFPFVWIRRINRPDSHKSIHTQISNFLSVKSILSTITTGPTITTKLKKGSL